MKLKFKVQPYQTNAVESVVDCFAGQPMTAGLTYRIDPGRTAQVSAFDEGFKNADLALSEAQILENIQTVQRRQNLPVSASLSDFTTFDNKGARVPAPATYRKHAFAATPIHLDVEMETGTGKTYCYIKSLFEMNQRYGWSKFIIMVPSIAIREGVYKSLQITAEHFTESYGKKARFFIYHSKRLHELESFSSDAGINVMVINIQAFNARGADNRRIYLELDDFQSRKPIDVIASNRPILIIDEPQKMEGKATLEALPQFKPLFILRYSATHKTQHHRIHRLDALDAYNQKLVKKIAVRGIQTRGLAGTNAYLYLEGIDISKQAPVARIELEVKLKSGEIKRQLRRLRFRDDLFVVWRPGPIPRLHHQPDRRQHRHRRVHQRRGAQGRRGQRRCLRARHPPHPDPRDHQGASGQGKAALRPGHQGAVAVLHRRGGEIPRLRPARRAGRVRASSRKNTRSSRMNISPSWRSTTKPTASTLRAIDPAQTHQGYFAVDKKTKRLKDPAVKGSAAESDDIDAYDLILKDKESLLAFPTRQPGSTHQETGALHLLALGPARRLGQPERLRHVHAQAQRQQHLASAGSRARAALERRPAGRAHGSPEPGA